MEISALISNFFENLTEEKNRLLKNALEGNFSEVGEPSPLQKKFIADDEELFEHVIPMLQKNSLALSEKIIKIRIGNGGDNIRDLYRKIDLQPEYEKDYELQIHIQKELLSKLSEKSLREESDSVFNITICSPRYKKNYTPRQNQSSYYYTYLLSILFDDYSKEQRAKIKYGKSHPRQNSIYRYYESLGVDLQLKDKQFRKYDLLSVANDMELSTGLPSRIVDKINNVQFIIDAPEHILELFVSLLKISTVKDLAILAEQQILIESEKRISILLGNYQATPLISLIELTGQEKIPSVMHDIKKSPSGKNILPIPYPSIGRLYEAASEDSAWYFIDSDSMEFEEISQDLVALDDCVVTQLIHIEYFLKNGEVFISHIDHEYIFYTYQEFDNRLKNFNQKGGARKRIKTFKIDNSEIPLVLENDTFFLYTVIAAYFEKHHLLKDYLVSMVSNLK